MSLPNYFLADLPPEAALSPAMITAACETLKHNRQKYLARRKTVDIVNVLCAVAAGWLEPDNKFRRLALAHARSPDSTARLDAVGLEPAGFSPATMARGLDDFFRRFTPENFKPCCDRTSANPSSRRITRRLRSAPVPASLATSGTVRNCWSTSRPGNLPNPALMSLTLGLLTRSAQFMKCASGASLSAAALCPLDL